jgi:hypothetical protein
MSTSTKPEPTAVAVRDVSHGVGRLPPEVEQQLQLRRMRNQIAGELAKQNWGKSLDENTRRAIADWGQQFRVDTTTEIQVLGGNVYPAAVFYLRKLSEMIDAGLVEYAYPDHVEADSRLRALGPEGEGEFNRRLRERIKHAIPDAAASSVIFRVKLRSMDQEVTGTKWCGGGTRKNDPVGEQFPVETSETRAARRCMRQITSHVPPAVASEIRAVEDSAELLSEHVKQAKARIADVEATRNPPRKAIAAGVSDDPYAQVATNEQKAEITELLDRADVTDDERAKIATTAGAKDYRATDALALIERLASLVPQSNPSDDQEG